MCVVPAYQAKGTLVDRTVSHVESRDVAVARVRWRSFNFFRDVFLFGATVFCCGAFKRKSKKT